MRSSYDLMSILPSVQRNQRVILTSLFEVSEFVTRNLLCHFEKLNIRNYILMGPRSDFLIDLARRGHPVIDVDASLSNVGANNVIASGDSGVELIKDILVKAYVMKKSMELKENILVVYGNMIFDGDNPLLQPVDLSSDSTYGKKLGFLFLCYSSSAQKHLAEIFVQEARAVVSTPRNGIPLYDENKGVLAMVVKALERRGVEIRSVDDGSFAVNIITTNVNRSSITD